MWSRLTKHTSKSIWSKRFVTSDKDVVNSMFEVELKLTAGIVWKALTTIKHLSKEELQFSDAKGRKKKEF